MSVSTLIQVTDWKGLRQALGLSQHEIAQLLSMADGSYCRLEHRPSGHARESTIAILRAQVLHEPELQARLRQAQYPYPWPLDLVAMAGLTR
jgi:transcriptional regulator with XRE-family HTH domain